MEQICLALVVLVLMVLSAIGGSYLQKRSFSRDARSLAYYESTMLRKQGGALGLGQYELLSFDAGKRWYAVDRDDGGAVIIRGVADDVFPGLLSHLDGMDALVTYVKKNGPLTLSENQVETDRTLLESAGFTVTERS